MLLFMPVAGLEPARGCPRQILSLLRLPFRHTGNFKVCVVTTRNILSYFDRVGKRFFEKNYNNYKNIVYSEFWDDSRGIIRYTYGCEVFHKYIL